MKNENTLPISNHAPVINHDEMLSVLKETIRSLRKSGIKTQREIAQYLDTGETYLSDILRGQKKIGPKLAESLGYRKEYMFVKEP